MSQTDAQTKEIDGYTYEVVPVDPLVATDMLAGIGEVAGPSLGALAGALAGQKNLDEGITSILDGGDSGSEPGASGASLERAFLLFFQRFSKEKQREFISILSKVTTVHLGAGKKLPLNTIFPTHFRGRVLSLYKWFGFAMSVQFKGFFSSSEGGINLGALLSQK